MYGASVCGIVHKANFDDVAYLALGLVGLGWIWFLQGANRAHECVQFFG